jgi:chemotaxis response regulator CheB
MWRTEVSEDPEPNGNVSSVLVIAADPIIETLIGELVELAGRHAIYDATAGAAGESIRRIRPDVVVIDTSLPTPVIRACLGAADEVQTRPILVSSTASESELAQQATAERRLYFPLPGGPKSFARILETALLEKPTRPRVDVPLPVPEKKGRVEQPAGDKHGPRLNP